MRNRVRQSLRHAFVTAMTLLAPVAIAGTTATFTPVGPLDANVLSMSADGSVIVGAQIFGPPAFRWTREGGTQNIGDAFGQVSISRDGSRIVGDITFRGHTTAAIWQGGTTWRSLRGYPGSDGCPDLSDVYAVSDGGEVVVGLGWDGCDATGFRWEQVTGMVSLGSLDGNASRANDLSADGQVIVGWDDSDVGERRGARWVNAVESLLAQPGGLFLGGAEATNADGSVIVGGNAGNDIKRNRAYRWSEDQGGELLGILPGGGNLAGAYAFAVSDDGRVAVGASGAQFRDAFVWTRATGMFKLQDYLVELGVTGFEGWRLDTALAISSDGTTIAGWGVTPDGHVQGWVLDHLPPFSDQDADTVLDAIDNCTLRANSDQRDTDGDRYGNICDPDFDNDLIVDRDDVDYLRSVFHTPDPDGDLDGNGVVGAKDAIITRNYLGHPPGPSGLVP